MGWDNVQDMFRHLNSMAWGYQLEMERKMFSTVGEEYRCVLVRWDITRNRKREVLLETSNPKHMEAILLLLIKEAEAQAKANNVRGI